MNGASSDPPAAGTASARGALANEVPDDIVLVDDDPMVAEFAVRMLRRSERTLRLRTFTDPFDALEHLATRRPAVLIVDTRMPGMDGPELIGRLAQDGHLEGVRTILCSASREVGAAAVDAETEAALPPGLERIPKEVLYDRRTLLERLDAAPGGPFSYPSSAAESSGSASNRSATRP